MAKVTLRYPRWSNTLVATPEQKANIQRMTAAERVAAMYNDEFDISELCFWARIAPKEVPLVNGEFWWIAMWDEEYEPAGPAHIVIDPRTGQIGRPPAAPPASPPPAAVDPLAQSASPGVLTVLDPAPSIDLIVLPDDDEAVPARSVAAALEPDRDIEPTVSAADATPLTTPPAPAHAGTASSTRRRRPAARPRRSRTDDEILERIRDWNALYGEPPRSHDWNPGAARRLVDASRDPERIAELEQAIERFTGGDWPSAAAAAKRFGGWDRAIAAAGLTARGRGNPTWGRRAARVAA